MVIDLGKAEPDAVFFISPARSGTMYLADFLTDYLEGWEVQHEPVPRICREENLTRDTVMGQLRWKRSLAMQRGIKGYAETDHSFIRVFSPYVEEVFPKYRVVHLLREPLRNAVSLQFTQGNGPYIQSSNPWDNEITCPDDINHYVGWSSFQKWIYHVYECHARGFTLREKLVSEDRYYPFSFTGLDRIADKENLAKWIDPKAHARCITGMRTNKMTTDDTPQEGQIWEYRNWYEGLDSDDQEKVDFVNLQFGIDKY